MNLDEIGRDSPPSSIPHEFQDLENRINAQFIDTLKKVFEARAELDSKTSSRLIGSQVRTPEEVKTELRNLKNSLDKLVVWAETTQKQIDKTLDPTPEPQISEIAPLETKEASSWFQKLTQWWS